MNHLPYETWILDGNVPREMHPALQEHLVGCPQCQILRQSWQGVRQDFRVAGTARPAPGFTMRWQAGLAARRARQQQVQVVKTVLIFLGTLGVLGFIALGVGLLSLSPIQMITGFSRSLSIIFDWLYLISHATELWFNVIPLPINLAIWMTLASTVLLFTFGWGITLWRYLNIGVSKK